MRQKRREMPKMNLLKAKIVEKEMNQSELSSLLGIDESTFYRKMKKNGYSFTVKELQKIKDILNLNGKDVIEIFLS